jgi:hypothetical protein
MNWKEICKSTPTKIIAVLAFFAGTFIPIYQFFHAEDFPPELSELKCEALSDVPTIQVAQPLFTWKFRDQNANDRQDSVFIQVGLRPGAASHWDHRYASAENQVRYAGKILRNHQLYHWSLQVVDRSGLCSQIQQGQFKTGWPEQPIIQNLVIYDQEQMDGYILRQYLDPIAELAQIYQDANAGAECHYLLDFRPAPPDSFGLKIQLQSNQSTPGLTFSETCAAKKTEPALWTLLEKAYQKLKLQLDKYHVQIKK